MPSPALTETTASSDGITTVNCPAAPSALERGRRLESLLLAEGVRLIESLRAERDAD